MSVNIPWSLFRTEIGLIVLSLSALLFDIFLPDNEKRGKTLANLALIGIAVLLGVLCISRENFGSGLNGTLIQDGLAVFFKILFLLAGFFTLFMAREYQARLKRGHSEFILLILFSLIGMLFIASANDFL